MQIFLFQISSFFQLLFPLLYRRFGNLEDLVGRFQAITSEKQSRKKMQKVVK